MSSPEIFRKWTAIGTIAAALERRVWVRSMGSDLYPNLYIVLVGNPGVGKSTVLVQGEKMLRAIPDLCVAASSVSSASLIDSLKEAHRKIIRPNQNPAIVDFNNLVVVASELGVFLPMYESTFMSLLTKAYDGEFIHDKKRGHRIDIKIERPLLTILGGTTPSYLNSFLPEGAWDQGFTSRSILIYSGALQLNNPFLEEDRVGEVEKLYKDLLFDLKIIAEGYGKMQFEREAAKALSAWHLEGGPPVPEHGKLTHYNSRRTAHLLKLCMVASASRGQDFIIKVEDYQTALNWLIEAELFMPDIFKAMVSGGNSHAIEDTWHYVWSIFSKEKNPVAEHRIMFFLSQRVPAHYCTQTLEIMISSGMLESAFDPNGRRIFKPTPKAARVQ